MIIGFIFLGIIALHLILACICKACESLSPRLTRSSSVQLIGVTSTSDTTIQTHLAQRTDEPAQIHLHQTDITNVNITQGPPLYTELSFAKKELTTPPPSYEDVTSHPTHFEINNNS